MLLITVPINALEIANENLKISSETEIQDNVSEIESENVESGCMKNDSLSIETEIPNNENQISAQSEKIGSSTIPPISGGSGSYFLQVVYVNYDKTEYTYGPRIASSTTYRMWYYNNKPETPKGYELKGWQSSHYHGTNSFLTKAWWPISGSNNLALTTTNPYNQTVVLNSGEGVYLIYQEIEKSQTITYTYELTWDYNGGKVGNDTQRTKTVADSKTNTYTFYEDEKDYGSPRPIREGYTFNGWIYKNNGTYTGGKFIISNGQIIMTGIDGQTVSGTLIAQWNYTGTIIPYRVEWYDKKGNTLKETSYRTGLEGETKVPTDEDYIIDGYIFDNSNDKNILSKTLKENEENVLKLYFYKPVVNLHFTKSINGDDESFNKIKLNKNDAYKFPITLTNQETGNIIQGILDSKNGLQINDIPIGTYLVKESDDMYFDFVSMEALNSVEGIAFEKTDDGYILTITESTIDERTQQIEVTNKIEPNRFYEDKKEKLNLFGF